MPFSISKAALLRLVLGGFLGAVFFILVLFLHASILVNKVEEKTQKKLHWSWKSLSWGDDLKDSLKVKLWSLKKLCQPIVLTKNSFEKNVDFNLNDFSKKSRSLPFLSCVSLRAPNLRFEKLKNYVEVAKVQVFFRALNKHLQIEGVFKIQPQKMKTMQVRGAFRGLLSAKLYGTEFLLKDFLMDGKMLEFTRGAFKLKAFGEDFYYKGRASRKYALKNSLEDMSSYLSEGILAFKGLELPLRMSEEKDFLLFQARGSSKEKIRISPKKEFSSSLSARSAMDLVLKIPKKKKKDFQWSFLYQLDELRGSFPRSEAVVSFEKLKAELMLEGSSKNYSVKKAFLRGSLKRVGKDLDFLPQNMNLDLSFLEDKGQLSGNLDLTGSGLALSSSLDMSQFWNEVPRIQWNLNVLQQEFSSLEELSSVSKYIVPEKGFFALPRGQMLFTYNSSADDWSLESWKIEKMSLKDFHVRILKTPHFLQEKGFDAKEGSVQGNLELSLSKDGKSFRLNEIEADLDFIDLRSRWKGLEFLKGDLESLRLSAKKSNKKWWVKKSTIKGAGYALNFFSQKNHKILLTPEENRHVALSSLKKFFPESLAFIPGVGSLGFKALVSFRDGGPSLDQISGAFRLREPEGVRKKLPEWKSTGRFFWNPYALKFPEFNFTYQGKNYALKGKSTAAQRASSLKNSFKDFLKRKHHYSLESKNLSINEISKVLDFIQIKRHLKNKQFLASKGVLNLNFHNLKVKQWAFPRFQSKVSWSDAQMRFRNLELLSPYGELSGDMTLDYSEHIKRSQKAFLTGTLHSEKMSLKLLEKYAHVWTADSSVKLKTTFSSRGESFEEWSEKLRIRAQLESENWRSPYFSLISDSFKSLFEEKAASYAYSGLCTEDVYQGEMDLLFEDQKWDILALDMTSKKNFSRLYMEESVRKGPQHKSMDFSFLPAPQCFQRSFCFEEARLEERKLPFSMEGALEDLELNLDFAFLSKKLNSCVERSISSQLDLVSDENGTSPKKSWTQGNEEKKRGARIRRLYESSQNSN